MFEGHHRDYVNEDPHDFLDEVYKFFYSVRVSSNEKAELVAYKLKDVPQTWYTQLKDNRALRADPIIWEILRI